jgi:son of sevenless-like protein
MLLVHRLISSLIEFEIFEKIQPKECLSQAWNKPNKEEKAPNITKMIQRTNRVVLWVAAEILQYEKQSRRTYAIRKFIKLATALRKLNNFNACKEIVGGLRSIPVSRLTKSWEALPTKFQTEFHELEELMHQKKSYGNMRVALKNTNTCALPYIGMFLTDLTFVEDGNKDITDGLINFFKRQKYAVVIREMLRLQSERYAFTVVPDLQNKLLNLQEYNEDKLLEISYKYEPKK